MGIGLLERRRTPGGEKIIRPANSKVKNELVAMVASAQRNLLTFKDWRVCRDSDVLVSCIVYVRDEAEF